MPSEKQPFYDPVPPTYDEALIGSSRRYDTSEWDDRDRSGGDENESHSLLRQPGNSGPSSSRAPAGYQPPTVETDDEDSLFGDSDDGEEAQVRRELEEMDIEEPNSSRGSVWAKRIPFSLSLPRWKWSWRPRLPSMPRMRIQLPQRDPDEPAAGSEGGNATSGVDGEATTGRRWAMPKVDGMVAVIIIARALAIFIILGFIYLLFVSDLFGGLSNRVGGSYRYNPEELRAYIQKTVDPMRMRASVQHFSSYAHLAGTEGSYDLGVDMEKMFAKAGLDEYEMEPYYVYLNYPTKNGREVSIMDKDDDKKPAWTAILDETDRGEEIAGRMTYAFHGLSKTGTVKGPLIYANYGSRDDFKKLKDEGVKTQGAIALVRYYGTQPVPALKVLAAENAGFAGCIIYSDPADDGFEMGSVAPNGRFMPADGVHRASVGLTNMAVGDVLTPGWESKQNVPRMRPSESPGLVGIPSLPLAWRDAQVLLQRLKGHGKKVAKGWEGRVPDVEWWTGDEKSPIVQLKNEQDEVEQRPIYNIYGRIQGIEQGARSVIIGNHRDAFSLGAVDPHTGTAVMVEMARIFGDLVAKGWRPLRTIEFMSWDGGQYNLVGSTEYVEQNLDKVRENAYAYINLDAAVTGPLLNVDGSPVFRKTLMHALNRVLDPNHNITLKDMWDREGTQMGGLGAESDYVAFQDIAGTSSIDLSFRGQRVAAHSAYDDLYLVENLLDPDFTYHGLLAQILGLMILDLSDRAIIPFDISAYGTALERWTADLETWAKKEEKAHKKDDTPALSFKQLRGAAKEIAKKATEFAKWEMDWDHELMRSGGWEAQVWAERRLEYNDKMVRFETALLDTELGGGIPGRTQFKHTVYGPQQWSYDVEYFPAIRTAVSSHDWDLARRIIATTTAIFHDAGSVLNL